jgi:hypothetical protein
VCHGLYRHNPDVAFSAQRQQLLGRLPIAGKAPEGGVDREHDRVEIKAPQSLQEDDRYIEVMAGDPGEPCLAVLAQCENSLQCPGSAIQLLESGDGVGLV